MVKLFIILRRKPGMTPEEFHHYWKEKHGPLVAKLPGLVKYTQHHVMSMPREEYATVDAPIDGVVEVWLESPEAMAQAQGSPELQAVLADEKVFMGSTDHHIHTLIVTESVELVSHATPGT